MSISVSEAKLIEFAKSVELTATKVLEGMHTSRRGGEGLEFHSSLPYAEGEDARHIDWKRFAATEKYFSNRYQKEEKTGWNLLIDSSASMEFGKKLESAKFWVASIIFLANAWADRWFLYPDTEYFLEAAFQKLSSSNPNEWGFEEPKKLSFSSASSGDRLLVFSDFFWEDEILEKKIEEWSSDFSSLYLIQTLDSAEIDFSYSGVIEFRDRESSEKLLLDSARVRKRYEEQLRTHQKKLTALVQDHGFLFPIEARIEKTETQLLDFFERL